MAIVRQTEENTLGLYFVWPDADSSWPNSLDNLIPAAQVKEMLAQSGMRSLLADLAVQSVYTRVSHWCSLIKAN